MKNLKRNAMALSALIALLAVSGCADHAALDVAATIEKVGFWHGLWYGFIFPFAWIVSLFDSGTAVYAIYNNGGWYDFGFFLGVGGLSATAFNS